MKISWIKKENSENLILFFGGFASDENLLESFDFGDNDVLMFCDYADFDAEIPNEIFEYSKVGVIAWSFGVWVADFLEERLPRADLRIALCGSASPVDDNFGIPSQVFSGTLGNFSEPVYEKFLLRVFGAANFKTCKAMFSKRACQELKAELQNLADAFKTFK
ncbi:MAG: DUF452 family protein, partial [Opitutales bacterium]|nr:DUF452 family protein [Opitutales bacterium]